MLTINVLQPICLFVFILSRLIFKSCCYGIRVWHQCLTLINCWDADDFALQGKTNLPFFDDSIISWLPVSLSWWTLNLCTGNINWKYLEFVKYSASFFLVLHYTQEKKTHYSKTPIRNRNLDYTFLTYIKITLF